MKILIVCQLFYPESIRINDIAFSLAERGHDVTVLTGLPNYPKGEIFPGYRRGKKRRQIINGVEIIRCFEVGRGSSLLRLGINYISFMFSAMVKARQLKDEYDIIYCYQLSPVSMVAPALVVKKKKQIPLVLNCLDLWPVSITAGPFREGTMFYRLLYWFSKKMYMGADIITVTSKLSKKYFCDTLLISEEEKKLIYWPQYAEDIYGNIPRIQDKTYDLLYAGNIGPATDVETIVKIAAILKNENHIRFHIVGDGMNLNSCSELARRLEVNNIFFYGAHSVENMMDFYSKADAFLITIANHPVNNNTLPAKIQSYMLAGKPIFGAANGETARVISEARCGGCVKSGDAEGLAEMIRNAALDMEDMAGFGLHAKQYYMMHFDKEKRLDELTDIFIEMVKKNKSKNLRKEYK